MHPVPRDGRVFVWCPKSNTFHDWSSMRVEGELDAGFERLELRTAACGNTLSIIVAETDDAQMLRDRERAA